MEIEEMSIPLEDILKIMNKAKENSQKEFGTYCNNISADCLTDDTKCALEDAYNTSMYLFNKCVYDTIVELMLKNLPPTMAN